MTGASNISFVWQGGEPTLAGLEFFRKAVQLQEMYRYPNQRVSNSIQTNGVLVDEEWARFYKEKDWLVGVSLDGPASQHDAYRVTNDGSGSYEKVIQGIGALRSKGVEFNILALLNDINVKKPKALYRWLVGEGFKHLQFIPCVETGSNGEVTGFSITPQEYGEFLVEVFDEWKRDIPEVYVRDFEDLLIGLVTGEAPNCVYNGKCGEYLVVEHNGDAYPCDFFVERRWLLGNINQTGVEELYNGEAMNSFRENRKLHEKCGSCNHTALCHGGCLKSVTEDGYYFCESIKHLLNKRGDKLQSIADRFPDQT